MTEYNRPNSTQVVDHGSKVAQGNEMERLQAKNDFNHASLPPTLPIKNLFYWSESSNKNLNFKEEITFLFKSQMDAN